MHWIIQNNLYEERGYDIVMKTIERWRLTHTYVKVIPFAHTLEPEPVIDGPTIVIGSITLGKIAVRRGWQPGALTNENFDYVMWRAALDRHLLNPDAIVCRFGDVTDPGYDFFIRPCYDDKSFTGMTTTWEKFVEWQEKVCGLRDAFTTLDENTMVCYSPIREIHRESRFWVVDGRVQTGSQYKVGRRVVYKEEFICGTEEWRFAQQMVELWQPAKAFVIDIANTPHGCRVIEIGCLNSAGFYACDVQKLILTLEEKL